MAVSIEIGTLNCEIRSWGEKYEVPIVAIDEARPDDPNLTEWFDYTHYQGTLKATVGSRRRVLEYIPVRDATCSLCQQLIQCSLSATQTISVYEVSHFFYYERLSQSATWNSYRQLYPSGSSSPWGTPGADLGAFVASKTGPSSNFWFDFTTVAQKYLGGFSIPLCFILDGADENIVFSTVNVSL